MARNLVSLHLALTQDQRNSIPRLLFCAFRGVPLRTEFSWCPSRLPPTIPQIEESPVYQRSYHCRHSDLFILVNEFGCPDTKYITSRSYLTLESHTEGTGSIAEGPVQTFGHAHGSDTSWRAIQYHLVIRVSTPKSNSTESNSFCDHGRRKVCGTNDKFQDFIG